MLRSCNGHVAQAIWSLFGSSRDSDCEIIFCLEKHVSLENQNYNVLPGSVSTATRACVREVLAESMPAHQFVLRYASERFSAQLARWSPQEQVSTVLPRTKGNGKVADGSTTAMQSPRTEAPERTPGPAHLSASLKQCPLASSETDAASSLSSPSSPRQPLPPPPQHPSLMAGQHVSASSAEDAAASPGQPPAPPTSSHLAPATPPQCAPASAPQTHHPRASFRPPQQSSQPSCRRVWCSGGRPQLLIPLGSQAEFLSARAAIRFAYTGEVVAGSIREALEVRQQGAYLQISGCVDACDEVIQQKILADTMGKLAPLGAGVCGGRGDDVGVQPRCNGGGSSRGHGQAVLELFACEALWPDPEVEPSFTAIVEAAKPLLISHFGDALATLNTQSLKHQLLGLPAVGLEVLLTSNDFGTDSESTILLLLATWMEANYKKTDAEIRQWLCRAVRLVQLSRPYLSLVLPALAVDHEKSPESPAGWFAVDSMDAAFVIGVAHAPCLEQRKLLEANGGNTAGSHSLRIDRRIPCIPAAGLPFHWHIPKQELQAQLQQLQAQPSTARRCYGTFGDDASGVTAWGLHWQLSLVVTAGTAAGLFLWCDLPHVLRRPGSRLSRKDGPRVLTQFVAQVVVHRRHAGLGDADVRFGPEDLLEVGLGLGWPQILYLRPQVGPAAAGGGGGGDGGDGDPLAAWADYLHDGKISGTLTLLRND